MTRSVATQALATTSPAMLSPPKAVGRSGEDTGKSFLLTWLSGFSLIASIQNGRGLLNCSRFFDLASGVEGVSEILGI